MAKKIVIRTDVHEERVDFEVNGESLAHFSYDEHGSAGMHDAKELVERLGRELGFEVEHVEGTDECDA